MKYDGHNYTGRMSLDMRKITESKAISAMNKELILKFKDNCFAEGISIARVARYMDMLRLLAGWLGKDFDKAEKADIQMVVAGLMTREWKPGRHYTEWTKFGFKVALKKFYSWLRNCDDKEYPPEVKWLKLTMNKERLKLPSELLTEDDVKRLINSSFNPMERAFSAMLYESGCRVGEILSLCLKNIIFDKYGAQIIVDGKTGTRRVRLIASVPYLQEWINKHPENSDLNSPLWINSWGGRLSYPCAAKFLSTMKKASGIKKRCNPHSFRHARATFLANKLTEAQLKEMFGWKQSSDMACVYVHLSGRDVDNALLKVNGIEIEKEDKDDVKFRAKDCPRCGVSNAPTSKFCSKCGMIVDEKEIIKTIEMDSQRRQADQLLDKLLQDSEFKQLFIQKMGEAAGHG